MHTVNGVQGKNPGIVSVSTSDTDEISHGTAVEKFSGHCRDESQKIVIHISALSRASGSSERSIWRSSSLTIAVLSP